MMYDRFELHNVAEAIRTPSGVRLYRFPKAVCDAMGMPGHTYGRCVAQTTAGCELRFVTAGDRARVSLTSLDQDGYVQVFRGGFRYYSGYDCLYRVPKGQVTHIDLLSSPAFEGLDPSLSRGPGGFAPQVWRVMSDINCTLALVDFEDFGYAVRPPAPDETPEKTLLCYGTSLSYGACASAHCSSLVQLLGRRLGVNVLNKAMGGSCMNEPEVADYFASDALRFDAVLLENAVNMGDQPDEYRRRTEYLLTRLTARKPRVPVYLLTSFLSRTNARPGCACPARKRTGDGAPATDRIMRELAAQFPQVTLLEGGDMMNDMTGLTCDLIHMSDYGQMEAAQNLAQSIRIP